jgi:D-lactate dehydrogenase
MKIAFFEATEKEKEYFSEKLNGHELMFIDGTLTGENIGSANGVEAISVFVNSEVKQPILDLLSGVKYIATRSTGFDHIDGAYAKQKGIAVSNVPSYGSRTVAEFAFGLILNLSRKIYIARHQLMEGDNFDISNLRGFDLYGKTLGVVGTGRIGKNVIKIANGFGMKIVAHDAFPDLNFAKEQNFEYVSLEELLKNSDIVTLHTPYNPSTHHLINKQNIGLMKKTAYLINDARGELVETDALVQALSTGAIAGAGLDVLENERQLKEESELMKKGPEAFKDFKTLFENQLLMDMPNVMVTPHIAFDTVEAVEEIMETTAENLKAFAEGKIINQING